jgi:glycosyltransferase involved in cell wall biosynthesis
MRITWLLETANQIWGGVKVALEDANWLAARGHQVTVIARSGPPAWMALRAEFVQVPDFRPERLPPADVTIGTFWTTVPWAAGAGRGTPVHFCQGYEGDNPENAAMRERIEAVYRLPGVHHVTVSPHLTDLLHRKFGVQPREVGNAIDHTVHRPGPERPPGDPLRVGLVGPFGIPWKDIATGLEAARLAHRAGQAIQLVRATNTGRDAAETGLPFAVEWHERVPPSRMGEIYRSLDVFLGTSSGSEEGFFLPAIEAMACGVPCVLTDIPCFRGYGDGQHALFVPPRDAGAMAEALVVAGRLGPVRAALREAGLRTARRFTQDAHGERLEQALLAIAVHGRSAHRSPIRALPARIPEERPTTAAELVAATAATLRQHAAECERIGDCGRAGDFLAAAACLLGDDVALLRALARNRSETGDRVQALQAWDRLLALGVEDADLHARRGEVLHGLGRHADAAQSLRAAIALGARDADTYNRLGVALFAAGDLAGARACFERALALHPGHGDAHANLGALPAA